MTHEQLVNKINFKRKHGLLKKISDATGLHIATVRGAANGHVRSSGYPYKIPEKYFTQILEILKTK